MFFALQYKVYADNAVKRATPIHSNRCHPRVGTLGLSVRVTMKTANGYHAKCQRPSVYDIARTLRPSVPTGGMATWRRERMPCFIVFYGTGPGMCCLNEIGRARNVRLVSAARVRARLLLQFCCWLRLCLRSVHEGERCFFVYLVGGKAAGRPCERMVAAAVEAYL